MSRSTRRRTSRYDFADLPTPLLERLSAHLHELVDGLHESADRLRARLLDSIAQIEAELIRRAIDAGRREAQRIQQVGQNLGYVFHRRFAMGVG